MVKPNNHKARVDKLKKELVAAKQANIKASALLDSIGEGVIVIDEYGRIEQVNDLACNALGYGRHEMLGKHFVEIVKAVHEDGSRVDNIDRPVTQAFLTGQPVYERSYFLTKNHTMLPVDIVVAPIIYNGVPSGAIETIRDLTDELAREKVYSDFISIASHQLRTPLTTINTYTQMLSDGYAGKVTDRQANFLNIIENSALKMNELIYTLLNVTRIEAGNININVVNVKVDGMCKEIVTSVTHQAESKNITIKCLEGTKMVIRTDPILLREVLTNLLSNAIKYTPVGGRVALGIKVGEKIVFSVKDNGYGVPERAKSYIFSKFYRANNAQSLDVSGIGIGLYLVKQLADKLGGDIWFTSKIGKGSTFYFSLPLLSTPQKKGSFTLETAKG